MSATSRPAPRGPYRRGVIGALRYRLTGHRMPLALTARVTWRCDALCSGCGMPNSSKPELTTAEWVTVLDDAARLGCVRVCFTGGPRGGRGACVPGKGPAVILYPDILKKIVLAYTPEVHFSPTNLTCRRRIRLGNL